MNEEELNQMSNNELIGIIKAQRFEIKQLENIRKEAIDYIENTDFDSEDNIVAKKAKDGIIGAFILENKIPKDLLNILNKVGEE